MTEPTPAPDPAQLRAARSRYKIFLGVAAAVIAVLVITAVVDNNKPSATTPGTIEQTADTSAEEVEPADAPDPADVIESDPNYRTYEDFETAGAAGGINFVQLTGDEPGDCFASGATADATISVAVVSCNYELMPAAFPEYEASVAEGTDLHYKVALANWVMYFQSVTEAKQMAGAFEGAMVETLPGA